MERLGGVINTSFSLHSVPEGSEVISEAEEIQEVHNLQHIGTEALAAEDFVQALQCYEEALEIDENNIESLCGRGEVFLKLGKYVLAQLDAEKVLGLMPKHAKALTLQGHALGHLAYYREALAAFLKAFDLETESDERSATLANQITEMAVNYCQVSDTLKKRLPGMDAYKKLCEIGACLYQAQKYDISIRVLNAAQKLQTNQRGIQMKILLTLANAHSALKHNDLAVALYQDCLAIAQSSHDVPYQTKTLVSIASLFLEMGETHQAIVFYEKLLDLQGELQGEDPDGPLPDHWSKDLQHALHLNLSLAYKTIGSLDLAVKHAKIYLRLTEGQDLLRQNAEGLSHQNIGMLLQMLGKLPQALEHFKRFLELSRKSGDKIAVGHAYGSLGSVYAKLGNVTLSQTYHEQFINSAKSAQGTKEMILAYEQFGDTNMYLEMYDEAVEQFMLMFKSCSRSDPHSQTRALCKAGTAYRAQKKVPTATLR